MTHYCISHIKDVDGLASAALVLAAKGGEFRLTDYDTLFEEMDRAVAVASELVICDLGTDPSKFPEFSRRLAELTKKMPVTYIDHHYLTDKGRQELADLGVVLHHDTSESAAMLTYLVFKDMLPQEARAIALYGAVTDYMDTSPKASRIMETFDRQFVLLESTLLSYALSRNGQDYGYLEMLVRELSRMKTPHTIDDVGRYALEQAEVVRRLADEVRRRGKKMGGLAYMMTDQSSTGNVAKLLIGAFDVPLGVAYKEKPGGKVEASLRCTSECRLHLGQEISRIAAKYGGSGGGHQKAAGFSMPAARIRDALDELGSLMNTTVGPE